MAVFNVRSGQPVLCLWFDASDEDGIALLQQVNFACRDAILIQLIAIL